MTNRAKAYIGSVAVVGFTLLAVGLFRREFSDLPRFLSYLMLALLSSTLKVRLPRITGTISVNFLFILIAIAEFSFSETIVLGCAAAFLQSVWRAKQEPRPVQILFNVACLAVSIAVAYAGSHFAVSIARADSLAVLMGVAACLFFIVNTGLVAGVLSLVERKPLAKIWRHCHTWLFPYYLVGASIAGLICVANRAAGWKVSLLLLPVMYLTYLCYRLYVERTVQQELQRASAQD